MRGNILCLVALYGIIPMVLYLFSKNRARDAVILSFFGAFMFLPMDKLPVPLILYTKMTATAMGVLIAVMVFDSARLENFRFHMLDIPMGVWCSSGFFSSVTNGLGAKDGLQECFNTFMIWGVPYLAGRLYFSTPAALSRLCRAFFIGGLLYIPPVLFELKMSPQLHRMVYGFMQHDFSQTLRGSGYRPMVFMEHGIMLGTFMAMAALVGLWCCKTKAFPQKMGGAPALALALVLAMCAVACKSSGATGLMLMGMVVLMIASKMRIPLLVWLLLAMPPTYIGTRATGYWDGRNLVNFISEKFSPDRAASLAFRFDNENILVEKALERPVFGWGGWGRSRVFDEETGEDMSVTDGFWVITLGSRGYLGLFSVTAVMLLPMLLFLLKCPSRFWGRPEYAPAAVLALIPLLFMIDCMLNAMVNPLYILFAGGITGMLAFDGGTLLEKTALSQNTAKGWFPVPVAVAPDRALSGQVPHMPDTETISVGCHPGVRMHFFKNRALQPVLPVFFQPSRYDGLPGVAGNARGKKISLKQHNPAAAKGPGEKNRGLTSVSGHPLRFI